MVGALLACVTSSSCSQNFPPFFALALLTPHGLTHTHTRVTAECESRQKGADGPIAAADMAGKSYSAASFTCHACAQLRRRTRVPLLLEHILYWNQVWAAFALHVSNHLWRRLDGIASKAYMLDTRWKGLLRGCEMPDTTKRQLYWKHDFWTTTIVNISTR